jgi:hypothetical protein
MLRRFILALAIAASAVGFTSAETFYSKILKVEGNKITYQKIILGKPAKFFDPATTETVKEVSVLVASKSKKDAEALKDGLANPIFKDIGEKGIRAWIITADVGDNIGKITQVTVRMNP